MSAFYRVGSAERTEVVQVCNDDDYGRFLELSGTPQASRWTPVAVKRVSSSLGKKLNQADFPFFRQQSLVMRRRAAEVLADLLTSNGELLDLTTEDGVELLVYNARVRDVLDYERSGLLKVQFPTDRIIGILRPHLRHSELLGEADIFRVPEGVSPTFVSERFRERVERAGLTGLVFQPVPVD